MVDETDAIDMESKPTADLIEEAEELIGTDALWRGQVLHAGVTVGIFDALDGDPIPASNLATDLELDPDRTYRLLRALAHFGVLEEDDRRRFSLTPLGELFREDHRHSVQSDVLFNRSREWLRAMEHLPAIVEDGGPPGFEREFGVGFFEYLASNPEFASVYNELMELASRDHPDQFLDVLSGYDFSRFSTLCDVGGGRGHFLCHLLDSIAHLEGVVFDLPRVIEADEQRWAQRTGVSDRCTYVAGDMFERVPESDCYILKWILHNWDDRDCRRILSNVHDAVSTDGRLFVIETLVPGPGTSHYAKRIDITMMTQVGGRERTLEEYRDLLHRSGWELEGTWVDDDSPMNVLEAVPG